MRDSKKKKFAELVKSNYNGYLIETRLAKNSLGPSKVMHENNAKRIKNAINKNLILGGFKNITEAKAALKGAKK